MKLIKTLSGLLLLSSCLVSFAQDWPKTVSDGQSNGEAGSNCQVEVAYPMLTYGGTCIDSNAVMTGIYSLNPLEIYCSQLQVNCDHQKEMPDGSGQGPTPASN
jgi:hypothetical protein